MLEGGIVGDECGRICTSSRIWRERICAGRVDWEEEVCTGGIWSRRGFVLEGVFGGRIHTERRKRICAGKKRRRDLW